MQLLITPCKGKLHAILGRRMLAAGCIEVALASGPWPGRSSSWNRDSLPGRSPALSSVSIVTMHRMVSCSAAGSLLDVAHAGSPRVMPLAAMCRQDHDAAHPGDCMLTLRLRKYSRMGSATASSSTPDASISRNALMVLTYCTMTSVVAAPGIRAVSDHRP